MSDEIDINKLHGTIKRYAQLADKDSANSKGYNKLNTIQEINMFKEMVRRNGKEAELLSQMPRIKGVSVPIKDSDDKTKTINKKIINHLKENAETDTKSVKKLISKKQSEI